MEPRAAVNHGEVGVNLEQIRAFLAVMEHGSVSLASKALGLSRATIRRWVDDLEGSAGTPLMIRTPLGTTPTAAGALLAARGQQMLHEADALMSALREVGHDPTGTIRLVLPVGLPPTGVAFALARLRKHFPELAISLRISSGGLAELLEEADVVFTMGSDPIEPGPWVVKELLAIPERLFAHRSYLTRHGTPTSPEQLRRHPLMVWQGPDGHDPRRLPLRYGGSALIEPALVTPNRDLLFQAMLDGHGLALMPDMHLSYPGVDPRDVVQVMPELVGRHCVYRAVVPRILAGLPKVHAVLAELTFVAMLLIVDFPDAAPREH